MNTQSKSRSRAKKRTVGERSVTPEELARLEEKMEGEREYFENYRKFMEARIARGLEDPAVTLRWQKFMEWWNSEADK